MSTMGPLKIVARGIRAFGLTLALGACTLAGQYPETLGSDINPNFEFRNLRAVHEQYSTGERCFNLPAKWSALKLNQGTLNQGTRASGCWLAGDG